jgi:hypothetical protein
MYSKMADNKKGAGNTLEEGGMSILEQDSR